MNPSPRIGGSRRRFVAFAALSATLSFVLLMATVLVVDVYVHSEFDKTGPNIWGYRGTIVGRKRPGEIRVVVAGGSTVLGYGLPPDASFPHQLELALNATAPGKAFSVVNLGFSNEGAYAFRYSLSDYAYLNYDVAVLYEGYNDMGVNTKLARHQSAVFRWTGYFPMLPVVAFEKILVLRTGDIRAAYRGQKTTFRPDAVARTKAALLQASLSLYDSLEEQAARWRPDTTPDPPDDDGCNARWSYYCHFVHVGIETALARHSRVIVVTQPYIVEEHREEQVQLRAMLAHRYAADSRVSYVNLGDAVDLHDPELCWDGMHLTAAGNQAIGRALAPAVLEAVGLGQPSP